MDIVLIGPPGSGKGTQASRLSRHLSIPHISSGDLLRTVRGQDDQLGRETKGYVDKGQLVPDDLIVRIIEDRLTHPDVADGFLLDGFPRTLAQAESLDTCLRAMTPSRTVELVIFLRASRDVVLRRMEGRWTCQQCGAVYNIPDVEPHETGHCDVCGAPLYQRSDEKPEIQTQRIDIYERDTFPLIGYYRSHGVLAEIDAEQTVEEVNNAILVALTVRESAMQATELRHE